MVTLAGQEQLVKPMTSHTGNSQQEGKGLKKRSVQWWYGFMQSWGEK